MSQLRAPTARPERREGGRHGRPGGRSHSAPSRPRAAQPTAPEGRLRPQLLRTALLPTVAAVLSGAAAVIFTIRASGVRPSGSLLAALGGSGALAVAAVAAAFIGAGRVTTGVHDRCVALRRTSARHHAELKGLVEQLRGGEPLPARPATPPVAPDADAFDLLAHEMAHAQDEAVTAVVQASQLFRGNGNEQKVEVFVNLARRLQSLVHREIQILDELEHEVEDPDLLKGLFHVDHLATRIRRHAENLAVLGGAVSRRQWSSPVTMTEVLRSAIAEVEQYPRVELVPPIDGTLRGHAVADVIHLLAELVENATVFSAPHTQVLLRAQRVTAGLALEVEDRGLGMPGPEQKRMNTLLSDPDQVNVAHLLQDGRIGLFVVASLARRHGIAVRLQSNIYGGTQAVLVLPQVLLGIDIDATAAPGTAAVASSGPAPLPAGDVRPAEPAPQPSPGQEQRPGSDRLQEQAPPLPLRAERVDGPNPAAFPPVARTAEPLGPPGAAVPAATITPQAVPADGFGTHSAQAQAQAQAPAPAPVPASVPVPIPAQVPASAPPSDGAGRPQLPRRSNQEHLVPQLREAPARRAEDDNALHDPGLMAAFRRGVDLAEAQTADEVELAGAYGTAGAESATTTVGAQRSHGLAPLPFRGSAGTVAAGTDPRGPVSPAPQPSDQDPRTENMFKE
ncbi:ATP-binding protein [Streptomyces sp. NBC_00178]|uniref:sensor histidine kinase n=1 Tax=Streptomyces sp. NBC_00178 TaxID=2975672 RepID=UPI002E29DF14|nr:ATP-binding protein [Streptomyces sp. NBC_00178]